MSKNIFTTEGLQPSQFSTAEEKAKFLNDLANFVKSGFLYTKFSKKLYTRLSMCFGHIAHYNKDGFYHTWFDTERGRFEWIQHIAKHTCYGSPEYTYSDAERKFIQWLQGPEGETIISQIKTNMRDEEIASAHRMKKSAEQTLLNYGVQRTLR